MQNNIQSMQFIVDELMRIWKKQFKNGKFFQAKITAKIHDKCLANLN